MTLYFTHLRSGELARDSSMLLTVILADAINLGLAKMAEACPGTTFHKLDSLRAWHVREETYSKALAEIVNHQHSFPFSGHWGARTTSSSDGQYFHVGGRGEHAVQVNARYGSRPGGAPASTTNINATKASVLIFIYVRLKFPPAHGQ